MLYVMDVSCISISFDFSELCLKNTVLLAARDPVSILFFSAARIGEGILLDHGTGLVIGETAVVGNWVSLMQASVQFRPFTSLC